MKFKIMILSILFAPSLHASDQENYLNCVNQVVSDYKVSIGKVSCISLLGNFRASLSIQHCADQYPGVDMNTQKDVQTQLVRISTNIVVQARESCNLQLHETYPQVGQ